MDNRNVVGGASSLSAFIDQLLQEPAPEAERDELKEARAYWEAHRGRLGVWADFWEGWKGCALSNREARR